jgi:peptidoglycan/LPS O-acetylase OafA/YrhL
VNALAGGTIVQAGERRSARVESLRAVAALGVVLSHALVFSWGLNATIASSYPRRLLIDAGEGGVDFFFVLSGYLLFLPFARAQLGGPDARRVDLRRYGINRVLRILPLYWSVLALLLIVQQHGGAFGQWWRFGLFLQDTSLSTLNSVDTPMWSLAVEVQFYLLLPLVALGIARLARGSAAWTAAALLVLAAGSFAAEQAIVAVPPGDFRLQYSLGSLFQFFAAGMGLALLRVRWDAAPPRWLSSVLGRSDLWIGLAIPLCLLVGWRFSYWMDIPKLLACVLVVGGCVLPLRPGLLVRVIDLRVLALLGVISYSIYLWQIPAIQFVTSGDITAHTRVSFIPTLPHFLLVLAAGGAATIAVAAVSYFVLEAPALRLRRRWVGARVGG